MSNSTVRTCEDLDTSIYGSTEESDCYSDESVLKEVPDTLDMISFPIATPIQLVGEIVKSSDKTGEQAIQSAERQAALTNKMGTTVIGNLDELAKRETLPQEMAERIADKQVEVYRMAIAADEQQRKDAITVQKEKNKFWTIVLGGICFLGAIYAYFKGTEGTDNMSENSFEDSQGEEGNPINEVDSPSET